MTPKGELARRMLARAFAAGVPAQWVVGDTLYGYDELRSWLEEQHKHYVLAIPETHLVWVNGRQQPVGYLAALLPPGAWTVLSAGEGSQGARLYEWSWFQLPEGGGLLEGADEKSRGDGHVERWKTLYHAFAFAANGYEQLGFIRQGKILFLD